MSSNKGPSTDSNNEQRLTDKKIAEQSLEALFKNLSLKEGEVKSPPKKQPGNAGKVIGVDTNIYQIQTRPGACVYRYDVTVTGKSKNGRDVDLTKKSDSSSVIADRLANCREAFLTVFNEFPQIFGENINALFYDFQSILYTLKPLDIPPNHSSLQLIVQNNGVTKFPGNLESITLEIKNVNERAQTIRLDDLSSIINDETLQRDRSVLNFIELAVNQYPMFKHEEFLTLKGSMVFFVNGANFNLPEKELDRGGTKYLASGVQKSATLIEGFKAKDGSSDPKQRKVGLMLEAKHSPFHSTLSLLDCINRHLSTTALYADFCRGNLTEHALQQLTRTYKKMHLLVIYPDGLTRKIELKSFHHSTANSHRIEERDETVADYFYNKYNQPLKYPFAHLIKVKQGKNDNFYPPEFLHIADNQIVTSEQMDAAAKASMIRACAVRPDEMKQENLRAAEAIHLHNSEFSNEVGIQFSKKTLNTEARVLKAPLIRTGNNRPQRVDEREAKWKMSAYFEPAKCQQFAVYILQSEREDRNVMTTKEIEAFIMELQRYGQNTTGLNLGVCADKGFYNDYQVEECIAYCANNDIQLCLFITPENIKTCHSVMKMCEHRYNVVTQDVKVSTARKMLNRGASATIENYMAKTNLKLGGLNHEVEIDDPDVMRELKESLFIGISTNQPGSKSIIDRVGCAKGKIDKPGVLGYCANIAKNYNYFLGDFVYTASYRPEFYEDLKEIFKSCVQRFTHNRGQPPKSVLFYYTGTSEGQFEAAYKYAIPLIRYGIQEANGEPIPLTVLAVQKVNNMRLFPLKYPNGGRDHEFNVLHGTVVDTTITSPVFSEFFLVPHSALKGTGRVPKYTVLIDENDYTMNILEGVTHALAFEHQIVSRSTAYPTPIYVAEGYAQRGRDILNAEIRNHENELPYNNENRLDLQRLSLQLNYSRSDLKEYRVNA